MDEGTDVSMESESIDVSAASDVSAGESVEIAALQNEAAALDIEPLDEGNNDDYFEIKGESSHNLGERIAAGALVGAMPFAAGISQFAETENVNSGVPDDIPAIYAESPYPSQTLEQTAEQFAAQEGFSIISGGIAETEEAKPSALQTAGGLAETVQDMAQALAERQRLRNIGERNDG